MDYLEILEHKIQQAAKEITALRQERLKLQAELQFLQEENKRMKQQSRDGSAWQDEKKTLVNRIERILKKINSLKI